MSSLEIQKENIIIDGVYDLMKLIIGKNKFIKKKLIMEELTEFLNEFLEKIDKQYRNEYYYTPEDDSDFYDYVCDAPIPYRSILIMNEEFMSSSHFKVCEIDLEIASEVRGITKKYIDLICKKIIPLHKKYAEKYEFDLYLYVLGQNSDMINGKEVRNQIKEFIMDTLADIDKRLENEEKLDDKKKIIEKNIQDNLYPILFLGEENISIDVLRQKEKKPYNKLSVEKIVTKFIEEYIKEKMSRAGRKKYIDKYVPELYSKHICEEKYVNKDSLKEELKDLLSEIFDKADDFKESICNKEGKVKNKELKFWFDKDRMMREYMNRMHILKPSCIEGSKNRDVYKLEFDEDIDTLYEIISSYLEDRLNK